MLALESLLGVPHTAGSVIHPGTLITGPTGDQTNYSAPALPLGTGSVRAGPSNLVE
jgi:hypothetical protein